MAMLKRSFVLTLGTGMVCGFFTFYFFSNMVAQEGFVYLPLSHPPTEEIINVKKYPTSMSLEKNDPFNHVNGSEALRLFKKVKVLCWVMTNPNNHEKKAKHVKATWGQHCNKFLIFSTKEDDKLDTIALPIKEGRDHLWGKTKSAFTYLYEHHRNDADWFMKSDDDTYVIVENLRYMLWPYDPNDSLWFGCRFKKYVEKGYMSGGAGYVLSRKALKSFVTEAIPNKLKCRQDERGAEDVEIGKCLQNVGVEAIDSRDEFGRGRFFPFLAEHHLIPGIISKKNWFWDYIYYPHTVGMNCCSNTAISFHYVSPNNMHVLEYFIYHLRPYGVEQNVVFPPPLPADKKGMPKKVRQKYYKRLRNSSKHEQPLPISNSVTAKKNSDSSSKSTTISVIR